MDKVLVTDAPDPACGYCKGTGVEGTCQQRGCAVPNNHMHTIRFCRCTNERYEEWAQPQEND